MYNHSSFIIPMYLSQFEYLPQYSPQKFRNLDHHYFHPPHLVSNILNVMISRKDNQRRLEHNQNPKRQQERHQYTHRNGRNNHADKLRPHESLKSLKQKAHPPMPLRGRIVILPYTIHYILRANKCYIFHSSCTNPVWIKF